MLYQDLVDRLPEGSLKPLFARRIGPMQSGWLRVGAVRRVGRAPEARFFGEGELAEAAWECSLRLRGWVRRHDDRVRFAVGLPPNEMSVFAEAPITDWAVNVYRFVGAHRRAS